MSTLIVDSAALSRNIEKLRRFTAAQIIAVVKGNGYGLGLVPYARFLTAQGVALLAVSTVEEAAALRDAGITAQLLMLSSTALPEEIAALLTRDVILTVGSADAARAVSAAAEARNVTARVHVKLDTGMGRYGFLPQETAEAAALLQALPAGWPVGYTGAYRTRRETRLALLPVGYTSGVGVTEETNALRLRDRLRRVLHAGRRLLRADGLTVLVNGCRCPVRGVVGATAIEADVTGVPCAVGDTVRIEVRPKFVDSAVPREYR